MFVHCSSEVLLVFSHQLCPMANGLPYFSFPASSMRVLNKVVLYNFTSYALCGQTKNMIRAGNFMLLLMQY
jgi:hypothetical protein